MHRARGKPRWLRRNVIIAAALLAGAALLPDTGAADGALAVGLPSDVAKQGLAMGYALNYATSEAAQEAALKRCREFRDAPQQPDEPGQP